MAKSHLSSNGSIWNQLMAFFGGFSAILLLRHFQSHVESVLHSPPSPVPASLPGPILRGVAADMSGKMTEMATFKARFSANKTVDAFIPQQWKYWEYCGGLAHCPPLERYGGTQAASAADDPERFLLFDSRGAGFNNERQSLELAFAMAFLWRRTLVLPAYLGYPSARQSLHRASDYFDVAAMSTAVKVISAEEFVAFAKANPHHFPGESAAVAKLGIHGLDGFGKQGWEKWRGWYKGLDGVALTIFQKIGELVPYVVLGSDAGIPAGVDVEQTKEFKAFATRSRKLLRLSDTETQATALYIPPRVLLGNFYTHIYVLDPVLSWQLKSAVRRAFRFRAEFFAAAAAAMEVAGLKPGQFLAIHDRQGDFEKTYSNFYVDPSNPSRFLKDPQNKDALLRYGKLYLSSRTTPSQARKMKDIFLPALQEVMPEPKEIYGLAGVLRAAAKPVAGHLPGWEGIVEMIICSQAGTFLGAYGSTFSGYIHRLRGYSMLVTDKRILWTNMSRAPRQVTSPSWAQASQAGQIAWQREWPEGYNF